jgi:hypothetical protein
MNNYWNYSLRYEKIYKKQGYRNIREQQLRRKLRYDRDRSDVEFGIEQKVFIIESETRSKFRELTPVAKVLRQNVCSVFSHSEVT